MNWIKNNIPNAITCLNLVCGVLACAMMTDWDSISFGLRGYHYIYLLIVLAAVFDFMDGLVARALNAVSAIGKELDSLCDLVSFGLVPGLLVYYMLNEWGDDPLRFVALLIPVCGALRLARFNIDANQSTVFTGLPIPANAMFWMGATALYAQYGSDSSWYMVLAVVVVSLLMVSPLRMFSLKLHGPFTVSKLWPQLVVGVVGVAAVVWLGWGGLAVAIAAYVLVSLVLNVTGQIR